MIFFIWYRSLLAQRNLHLSHNTFPKWKMTWRWQSTLLCSVSKKIRRWRWLSTHLWNTAKKQTWWWQWQSRLLWKNVHPHRPPPTLQSRLSMLLWKIAHPRRSPTVQSRLHWDSPRTIIKKCSRMSKISWRHHRQGKGSDCPRQWLSKTVFGFTTFFFIFFIYDDNISKVMFVLIDARQEKKWFFLYDTVAILAQDTYSRWTKSMSATTLSTKRLRTPLTRQQQALRQQTRQQQALRQQTLRAYQLHWYCQFLTLMRSKKRNRKSKIFWRHHLEESNGRRHNIFLITFIFYTPFVSNISFSFFYQQQSIYLWIYLKWI